MISVLHIKNIGIIDDLTVEFNKGLNILTGETGSGKTLIVNSLNIISGQRFSKEIMKKGAEKSFVEICFFLPEHPENEDGNIILSREIYSNGRNLCKINGRIVTVGELKKLACEIIDIHGQYDNQSLLNVSNHINLLDSFIEKEISKTKEEYMQKYTEYVELNRKLKENYGDDLQRQRTLDLLKYQFQEIEEASLKLNEEEELESKKQIVFNSQKIATSLNNCYEEINSNVENGLSKALSELEKIRNISEEYEKIYNVIQNSYYDIQEVKRDAEDLKDQIYFDENETHELQERLDLIFNLKRKYGNSIEKILAYKDEIEKEIDKITNLEDYIKDINIQIEKLKKEMLILSNKMYMFRKEGSESIEEKVNNELKDLNMKNAILKIQIEHDETKEFNINGQDKVEFLIRTNLGEDFKPLTKIASGGEISRIMLALKVSLTDVDKTPVLVFDEVDTGISGNSGNMVGEKLKYIAKQHQVLCITHLANIAAKGDYNYHIGKEDKDGHTHTYIKQLKGEEILEEIAQVASGIVSKETIEYAKKLKS